MACPKMKEKGGVERTLRRGGKRREDRRERGRKGKNNGEEVGQGGKGEEKKGKKKRGSRTLLIGLLKAAPRHRCHPCPRDPCGQRCCTHQ